MKSLAHLRAARAVDVPSALVALFLTAAAFAAVLVVSARTLLFQGSTLQINRVSSHETLVYLERPANLQQHVERPVRLNPPRNSPAPREMVPPRVSPRSSANRTDVSSTLKSDAVAEPAPIFLPPYRPQPRFTPSPFTAPRPRNPFLAEEPRTRAEMDSVLAELKHGIPLFALTRTPTAAERDSAMRDQSRGRLVPGREAQVPGTAQMSIGLPLFAPGPSAAERRRDSAANSEYVARLKRLQARVSASRESLRVADSMSRAHTP